MSECFFSNQLKSLESFASEVNSIHKLFLINLDTKVKQKTQDQNQTLDRRRKWPLQRSTIVELETKVVDFPSELLWPN